MKEKIIKFFNAYFKKEKLNRDFFDKDFLILLSEQSLLPYLYYVCDNKKANTYYYAASVHQESLNSLQQNITALFDENKIRHLYVKGSVLNHLYDDNALRTRGDIDVYIDIENLEKAKKLLLNDGFEILDTCMHHVEMKKNSFLVELHFYLFDLSDIEYNDFFKKPFEMSYLINDYCYELNHEEHFLFCLCHFARHLRIGAGIRYVLDFYYMLKKWTLDYNHLHEIIRKLHLEVLYQNILNVIEILTKEKFDIYEKKDVDFFIEYLLKNGVHGIKDAENYDEKNYGEKNNKFKHILKTVFITDKTFRLALYPKLGKHLILYPLCLIHRIIFLFIHKSKSLYKFIFTKKKRSKNDKNDFYKRIGI